MPAGLILSAPLWPLESRLVGCEIPSHGIQLHDLQHDKLHSEYSVLYVFNVGAWARHRAYAIQYICYHTKEFKVLIASDVRM